MTDPAHKRIDAGVKRGPKQRLGPRLTPPKTLPPGVSYHPSKLIGVQPSDLIARYLNGESSEQIAHSLLCTRQGLSYFLRKNAEDDWKEAQIVQAIERKDRAEDAIELASDPLSLAQAREQLKAAQWDLERLFNRMYGQKQEINHTVQTPNAPSLLADALQLLSLVRDQRKEEKLVSSESIPETLPIVTTNVIDSKD